MTTVFVIDASVVVKWYLPEIFTEEAEKYVHPSIRLIAPDYLQVECANVLCKKIRNNHLHFMEGERILNHLLTSRWIEFISTQTLIRRTYKIANDLQHPFYDCLYFMVAIQLGKPLVTADRKFYESVKNSDYSHLMVWVEEPPRME
ncbi:MAG: PIN domain-containing protein [Candidatus Omnitrophota bacterium]|jgi:predicted nucleic acid-binding protein|nr:MAG: PIN domain-containing protein [Candidatus Omnitrophota bacterium]